MRLRVLLAVALVLPLANLAVAAPPQAQPWTHQATSDVRDVAIASSGTTIAVAFAAPAAQSPQTDFAILDAETGFAKPGTPATSLGNAGGPAHGRNFTAVSADGATVVSVGLDPSQITLGLEQPSKVRLYHNRLATGTRWTPGAAETNGSLVLDQGVPMDLLLSADGTRLVLAVQAGTEMVVHGFTLGGSSLVTQFTYRAAGNVTDVAATPTLDTIAVAGASPDGNDTYATLRVIPFSSGTPAATHQDRTNGTRFTSVGVSRDGTRIVAGDARGQLHVVSGASFAQPLLLPGQATAVTRVLLADDASRIAAVMGASLVMLDGTTAPPAIIYNATHGGAIGDIAGNRTLGLLALAVNGTGIVGYGDVDNRPLWRVPGADRGVAMDAAGTYVAFSSSATGVGAVRIPRNITLQHVGGGDVGPAQPVRPQGSATFPLEVRNTGAAVERIRFEFQRGLDVTLTADPQVLVVAPDQVGRVNVTVTTGPLFASSRSFNVTAVSLTSDVQDEATLTLQLRDEPDVRFLLNDTGDIAVKQGDSRIVLLGVLNNGSTDVAVGIRATQAVSAGAPWDVAIDPASLTLAPNSVTTVRVTVNTPIEAADGTSNTLRFSLEGENVSDDAQVTFRVNPTLGVEVNAAGRVKFVEPGGVAWYNVTVTNTGSLPRRFEAFYEATPQGGKTWAIDMETSAFLLQPGATRTLLVRVFAPQDAQPNADRVSILVRARSFPEQLNETLAEGNITLFANAVEPRPTTSTTPDGRVIPGPGALVVAFAFVAVAFLHRRRRE